MTRATGFYIYINIDKFGCYSDNSQSLLFEKGTGLGWYTSAVNFEAATASPLLRMFLPAAHAQHSVIHRHPLYAGVDTVEISGSLSSRLF